MEVSRLSCKRGVDISMRIHPDHAKVWALPCMATDRTKCQAASKVGKPLVNCAKHCPCSEGETGSLCNFRQQQSCFNTSDTPDDEQRACPIQTARHAHSQVTLQDSICNERLERAIFSLSIVTLPML